MNEMSPPRPDLAECLRLALEEGGARHTPQDVAEAVARGEAQILTDHDGQAFVITEIVAYPQRRVLRLWLVGGKLDALLELEARVLEMAREMACDELEAIGRAGWLSEAGLHGWTPTGVVYCKDVE